MKKTRCIMVQGTMSGAGKSILCTALCRIFRQDGYKVAPFKSQNMALNSYITRDNLEMGRAQVVQAEAAGKEPDVRMNPVLLKPSSDTGSQVIVLGEVRGQMSAMEYFRYKKELVPEVKAAFDGLAEENDIIVIEGAGSPAEINLRESDIVNMGLAELVNAPVLLAGDIDRGGVFAQLYGTAELLDPEEKARIEGFIINKFRGDLDILKPGLEMLEEKTGIPVAGSVPYFYLDIEDEDSLAPRLQNRAGGKALDVAVISIPRISNFTDVGGLEAHPAVGVRYVRRPEDLKNPDLIIIPGTKSTVDDLIWMRECGLEALVQKHAAEGGPVIGICGGYQMLGKTLLDPDHVESSRDSIRGMGLIDAETTFAGDKRRTRVKAEVTAGPLSGAVIDGYEIHMGRTVVNGASFCTIEGKGDDGCWNGNVFGTYLHGLFDTGELTEKLVSYLADRKGISVEAFRPVGRHEYMDKQYDQLADIVREALDMDMIYRVMDEYANQE